jgi:hypothetical protein
MPRARTTKLTKIREAKKPERIASVRKARSTANNAGASLVSVDKPLTEMQKTYVKYRAAGETIPNAFFKAGYNTEDSYAYRMEKMPNIIAALKKEQDAYARMSELSKKDVMDMLKEAYDMAKLMAEPSSMVSAAREIGKMCGYYEPKKVEVSVSAALQKKESVARLTDAELFAAIEAGQMNLLSLESNYPDGSEQG